MKYFTVFCLVVASLFCTFINAKLTENLPKDAPLRIGITKRVENCKVKSKNGDVSFIIKEVLGTLVKFIVKII